MTINDIKKFESDLHLAIVHLIKANKTDSYKHHYLAWEEINKIKDCFDELLSKTNDVAEYTFLDLNITLAEPQQVEFIKNNIYYIFFLCGYYVSQATSVLSSIKEEPRQIDNIIMNVMELGDFNLTLLKECNSSPDCRIELPHEFISTLKKNKAKQLLSHASTLTSLAEDEALEILNYFNINLGYAPSIEEEVKLYIRNDPQQLAYFSEIFSDNLYDSLCKRNAAAKIGGMQCSIEEAENIASNLELTLTFYNASLSAYTQCNDSSKAKEIKTSIQNARFNLAFYYIYITRNLPEAKGIDKTKQKAIKHLSDLLTSHQDENIDDLDSFSMLDKHDCNYIEKAGNIKDQLLIMADYFWELSYLYSDPIQKKHCQEKAYEFYVQITKISYSLKSAYIGEIDQRIAVLKEELITTPVINKDTGNTKTHPSSVAVGNKRKRLTSDGEHHNKRKKPNPPLYTFSSEASDSDSSYAELSSEKKKSSPKLKSKTYPPKAAGKSSAVDEVYLAAATREAKPSDTTSVSDDMRKIYAGFSYFDELWAIPEVILPEQAAKETEHDVGSLIKEHSSLSNTHTQKEQLMTTDEMDKYITRHLKMAKALQKHNKVLDAFHQLKLVNDMILQQSDRNFSFLRICLDEAVETLVSNNFDTEKLSNLQIERRCADAIEVVTHRLSPRRTSEKYAAPFREKITGFTQMINTILENNNSPSRYQPRFHRLGVIFTKTSLNTASAITSSGFFSSPALKDMDPITSTPQGIEQSSLEEESPYDTEIIGAGCTS